MNFVRKLWQRGCDLLPITGFYVDRPLVVLQSDDWGRVGVRDQEGFEQLRSAGIALGDHPYDFHSLETAEDLTALGTVLKKHSDSSGRRPCIGMNFVVANIDFAKMRADANARLQLLTLANGLPEGWKRPNLLEAYRVGISDGVFRAAVHGTTHFCRDAVERNWLAGGERASLMRTLWECGTPYIYWRMPWVGYEYWDPEQSENEQFLSLESQQDLIGQAVAEFAKVFSCLPHSACAPGYRANTDTRRAWAQHGIKVAQNGPDGFVPPHFDSNEILQLTRTVELEPAVDPAFTVEACVRKAERCFARGVPAIVSVHSINFHSTLRDFRSRTLAAIDEFLGALEAKHDDLLYVQDEDLYELVSKGSYKAGARDLKVHVTRKNFWRNAERKDA